MKRLNYKPRIADMILTRKLSMIGAVLIEGPKWCGKTTTGEQHSESVIYMDDPRMRNANITAAEIDPSLILDGATPRLIDEWQIAPRIWDAVRFEVDHRDQDWQFILTGSAVPLLLDEELLNTHTGTGRIARLRMRTMSLWESGDSSGKISLKSIFSGESPSATCQSSIKDIAYFCCRGGWPRAVSKGGDIALDMAYDYLKAVVHSDISRVDSSIKNTERVERFLRSYARHIGSPAPLKAIFADMLPNEQNSLDIRRIQPYESALKQIFVIENMPAWNPNLRSKAAIRSADTRYFVDPSIAAAALGVGPKDLMSDLNTFGLIFENLCIRDLRVYAEALNGTVYHYRDSLGLECDAVMHLRDGRYGLIEIKLGGDKLIEEGATNLKKLRDKIDTDKMHNPSFMMILTAVGQFAFKRPDDVWVVPVTCLKD
ncbi:MAG: ATP-binding protein [Bacteroides sp.]|nr:ATP-binding protein [Bacteroides sp.]